MERDFEIGDLVKHVQTSQVGFIVDVVNIGFTTRWITVLLSGENIDLDPAYVEVISKVPRNAS
jgi:hypothetical protein